MPRSTALAIAAALLMVVAATAVRASWDAAGTAAGEPPAATTTVPAAESSVTATTEGGEVTFTAPTLPTTTSPPATEPPPPVGESTGLPFPPAASLSIGAGSSYSTSFTVGAPSPDDAVRWLLDGLEADGWDVVGVTPADGAWAMVEFRGPGARGQARVTDLDGDAVGIAVELAPPTV